MDAIRKYKIAHNTVVFDYFASILGAILLSTFTKIPLVLTTIFILLLGEIMHYAFNVKTNTLKYLGIL